jgi:hypothetical protein
MGGKILVAGKCTGLILSTLWLDQSNDAVRNALQYAAKEEENISATF